jgi:hypothetical protein
MKKKLFLMGMLAIVATFGLVVFGCASNSGGGNGGSETPPTPEKLVERLAADLNTIKAGSATVDSDTVMLTGEVYLRTSLTVPTGVTLDLTADKAKFELQNGAKLTVDGTVNTSGHGDHGSGWVEGGLRIGDGTAVINGSGIINLKSKGCILNISGDKRHLTLDGVTLVGIEDNDHALVQVGGGGEFVLTSGAITGNSNPTESGGGVKVNENGIFTMKGGEISGNMANRRGGGVRVNHQGTFIKTGGTIYGDTDNIHTPGSLENTVLNGTGHAILVSGSMYNQCLRNTTAGPEIKLYAKFENGVWTYNDTSVGGVGDTTANWE